mmetsp:Transcript_54206/g.151307  ORF Transcript_54206/g.151307 Transcript_54206/m.151307 type:complete len:309 (+) Transcript_54206:232-1158(+)
MHPPPDREHDEWLRVRDRPPDRRGAVGDRGLQRDRGRQGKRGGQGRHRGSRDQPLHRPVLLQVPQPDQPPHARQSVGAWSERCGRQLCLAVQDVPANVEHDPSVGSRHQRDVPGLGGQGVQPGLPDRRRDIQGRWRHRDAHQCSRRVQRGPRHSHCFGREALHQWPLQSLPSSRYPPIMLDVARHAGLRPRLQRILWQEGLGVRDARAAGQRQHQRSEQSCVPHPPDRHAGPQLLPRRWQQNLGLGPKQRPHPVDEGWPDIVDWLLCWRQGGGRHPPGHGREGEVLAEQLVHARDRFGWRRVRRQPGR